MTTATLTKSASNKHTMVLIALSVLGALLANIQPIYLGALAQVHGYSAQQLGLIGGIELGGSALASLLAPFWFGRVDIKPVATLALLIALTGNAITAWISHFEWLLCVRFIVGALGAGTLYALVLGLIGQVSNPDRTIAVAIMAQIISMAAAMIGLPLLLNQFGLPGFFLTIAACFSLGLLLVSKLPEYAAQTVSEQEQSNTDFYPYSLLLCLALFCVAIGGAWAFMERIGADINLPIADVGQALAFGGLIGGLGAFAAAIMDLRLGRIVPLFAGFLLAIIASLGLYGSEHYWAFFSYQALFNFCWNLILPYIMGAIARADSSGHCMVLVPATQAGGYALGSMLCGFIIADGPAAIATLVAAFLLLLCALLVLPLIHIQQRKVAL